MLNRIINALFSLFVWGILVAFCQTHGATFNENYKLLSDAIVFAAGIIGGEK